MQKNFQKTFRNNRKELRRHYKSSTSENLIQRDTISGSFFVISTNFKTRTIERDNVKVLCIVYVLYLIKLAQERERECVCAREQSIVHPYIVLHNIELIASRESGSELEARERLGDVTQCICAISREHYRGCEINRCEEDRIRKRRDRYDDSGGIIAHGGYVGLSRETRNEGVRIWGRREVVGEPQRCVREQLNL